eukprot:NODE_12372_length_1228_cov_20.196185.p1 GENE.NODE_12372_length_1228_cov_20.196185~~NODE_12372_length_1228_cov_20.196185.p1  ORF type:complete len:253 (+),score=47.88 NODE_12372_length_1228_cov_20.196185:192-950(+)
MSNPPVAECTSDTVEDKLRELYRFSDEPSHAKHCLLILSDSSECFYIPLVVRQGWEAWKQQQKDQALNNGVISALVLSIIVALAVSPLSKAAPDGSLTEDVRGRYADAYLIFCIASSFFSVIAVLTSFTSIYVYDVFCVDFDDFHHMYRNWLLGGWLVQFPNMISILLCEVALIVGAIVILPENLAIPTFWGAIGLTVVSQVTLWTPILLGARFAKRSYRKNHKDRYERLIQKVYREFSSETGTDIVEQTED